MINSYFKNAHVVSIDSLTEGQAITALMGMNQIDMGKPLVISACDHGLLYKKNDYYKLLSDPSTDIIVWGSRGHPGAFVGIARGVCSLTSAPNK